ncbi:MAG TPA: DUF4922 domain-containing protein [Terriglobia bacterium]|nr:DUF4922 domain-containing protein [Terriglobia bacterium]
MIEEVDSLFRDQIKSWPMLAKGIEGLAQAKTRPVRIDWFEVFVRHIPHRVKSTTAAVDRASIMKRPCFLCPQNQDPEEKGIAFGTDFILYCNPFPIVNRHLSIVHREHGAQRIEGQFGSMLDLARALDDSFVIYNGPECGASAPDHLHFQSGSRELFPIEADTRSKPGRTIPGYARNVLVFRSQDRSRLIDQMNRAIELLSAVTGKAPEPMINIAAFHDSAGWTVYLFPRGKHRPQVFHTGELTVSPASIDLCGIFVVPLEKDFERISGENIAAIFREVTLPAEQFNEVAAGLEGVR